MGMGMGCLGMGMGMRMGMRMRMRMDVDMRERLVSTSLAAWEVGALLLAIALIHCPVACTSRCGATKPSPSP